MRDFRDAKVMAQTLREFLGAKSIPLTHSDTLELTETYARSGTAVRGTFSSHHPGFRHHMRVPGIVLPGTSGYYDDALVPAPVAEVPAPASNDVRYTYTQDMPWDWAHRYPPAVVPSDRPYVSSCPTESVTVPGRGGDRTVNITRCY